MVKTMGKVSKAVLGGRKISSREVIIAVAVVLISLTVIFLVYPDALRTIATVFDGIKSWFLSLFGM